ncbi:uncharacterized protein SAPINGB_P001494 [Magnusiomyces paraingens]|uniref:Enoyl-CoA hydratase/isomerase domain-containing protein n=1 Tax=Magnusiomyces paraingens TaxID=2606893 RepID=A0A5E8B6J9_9ASCO|nr:uncharacterized protein SAPINGB_P001494 [Saprochaete ingens]VVT47000.1 unnamed protein product [Saprochaete ingens]
MSDITYKVVGKTAIISLNNPKKFNSLTQAQYRRLEQLMQLAAREPSTTITLLQSSGKFFSAGATVDPKGVDSDKIVLKFLEDPTDPAIVSNFLRSRVNYSYGFGARNFTITHTFFSHPKVFVVALNGPVIGLSAAIVALADFVIARDSAYLLTPFANLGLPPEGGTSYSLRSRLGHSLASELLLASSPVQAADLYRAGFINTLVSTKEYSDVDKFNEYVLKWIEGKFYSLHDESLTISKALMKRAQETDFLEVEHDEVIAGVNMFAKGYPQERFAALASGKLKHKL